MRVAVFTVLMGLGFVASAAAEGTSSNKAASPGATSKANLSEVRTIVHELEGQTDKLRELLTQYRSLVEQRPQQDDQLSKWEAAIERLLVRIDGARASVTETTQRLDKSATGELPTGLAKDVARAHNEADAERATAEQVLAKTKPRKKATKQAPPPEKSEPALDDDLDL
jgi:Mg-chelatase subunit ChlI